MQNPYWPLFGVRVVTPRIELRSLDDELCVELCTVALRGVHDPAFMPFTVPWTDAPSPTLEREAFRYWWGCRIDARPEAWALNLAVLAGGAVIGASGMLTKDFAVTRSFETGSWLGREHQGQGFGKELRMATLALGFDGFDAHEATTAAFIDNGPSLGVTRSLGYEPNGVLRHARRGELAESLRYRMSREHWDTIRRDDIAVHGVAPAREFLAC